MNINLKKVQKKQFFLYIMSFLLSSLLMALILLGNGIYPGSGRTPLVSDMSGQYMEFLASLRYIGQGDNSIFFNWSRSMGGNYLGLFAYYLASPLSWITVFFDLQHMPEAIYVLTLLKIGLCGLTFSIYLNRGVAKKPDNPVIILFACCYALMSYNIFYSFNIMWLDSVILLPLVLLGIERILEGKKGALYLCSITMCFITHYYMSYIVGVFSTIYLFYRLFCKWNKGQGRAALYVLVRFGINTLLGIGIAMPLLLPSLQDLLTGRIMSGQRDATSAFNFSFFEVFGKLFSSQYDTIANKGALPSLFCGTVMVFLTLLFFLQKKHSRREKAGAFAILAFLLLSFWLVELDKVWQCFQYPDWFPYRYAFVFSTMLLLLSYLALEQLEPAQQKLGSLIYRICCIFTVIELFFNGVNIIGELDLEAGYELRFEYDDFLNPTETMVNHVKEMDHGLYRMDKDYQFSSNDSLLLDYPSLTHFSSTFNHKVNEFTKELGLAQYYCKNMNYGSTLLTDSLFGVKYRIAERPLPVGWEELGTLSWYHLYQNPYALPFAYLADDALLDATIEWTDDPFANQNQLFSQLSGSDTECFIPIPFESTDTEETMTLTFTAPSDQPLYLRTYGKSREMTPEEQAQDEAYLDSLTRVQRSDELRSRQSEILVNGESFGEYFASGKNCNLYLGTFAPGEEVTIELIHKEWFVVEESYIAELNMEPLLDGLNKMAAGGLNITEHHDGSLKGTVTSKEGQALFTSIPYDKGFTVLVDGKEVEYGRYADTFMIIPLDAGTHEISISYISPGFTTGCIIAVLSLLLTILYYLCERRKKSTIVVAQEIITE